jgi:hypothetical protein
VFTGLSCFDHSSRPRSGIFVFASYSSTTIHGSKSNGYAIKSIWGESPNHVKEASKTKDYAATGRLLVAVGRHVTVRSQGLHGSVDGKCRSLVAVDGIPAVSEESKASIFNRFEAGRPIAAQQKFILASIVAAHSSRPNMIRLIKSGLSF